MTDNKHIDRYHQLLYYAVLIISGFSIYQFQIEKSFNLLSVYVIALLFVFVRLLIPKYSRQALPLFFVAVLYYLYPGIKFIYLTISIGIILAILLPKYSMKLKIILMLFTGLAFSFIYLIPNLFFEEIRYVPFVIGSIFMFRSISYIHEMRYSTKDISFIDKLNYFLLLPNLSMPLFPIVDFKNFVSSYAEQNFRQLKRGTLFACRGIVQLLLYRIIYHYLVSSISDVKNLADVFIYLLSNFIIVLRIIGAYHISIGIITLCGYSVPDLFNNLFFATGFSDLWRRTNIYWKDFITKIFYYPLYFRFKKQGEYFAIIISTLACFFVTWLLHNYQWFWIKGSFPVQAKDLFFWGIFGILVTMSSLFQQRKLHRKSEKNHNATKINIATQAFSSLGVFVTMSLLWSIWIAPDMHAWAQFIAKASTVSTSAFLSIALICICYMTIAAAYHYYQKTKHQSAIAPKLDSFSIYGFLLIIATLFVLMYKSNNDIRYGLLIKPIIYEKLNKADQESIDNGYYTNLINTNDYCTQVWASKLDITKNRTKYITQNLTIWTNDLMLFRYIPNKKIAIDQMLYSINSVGLHDREYSKEKPANTYRIIVLGGSYESGSGVNDDEDFISVVEKTLNENYVITKDGQPVKVEIINMAVNGYMLMQRMYQYKNMARLYHPDATFLFLHTNYNHRTVDYISRLINGNNNTVKDSFLAYVIKQNDLKKLDNLETLTDKLGFAPDSINLYAIKNIVQMNKDDKVKLLAVYLPAVKDEVNTVELNLYRTYSKAYDFPLINLEGVYEGKDKKLLAISEIDYHPNKLANDLIAKKMEESIIFQQNIFNLIIKKK